VFFKKSQWLTILLWAFDQRDKEDRICPMAVTDKKETMAYFEGKANRILQGSNV
jgi:hypothetical protein